ncbi:MAG: hypothetical protein NTY30_03285 [Candidatus Berkelbacteria bacterium]|nr:hypothetical protein [Candidatus Berkelbacteria bacterium]
MVKRNQQTILEKIVIGFFRGVWWLVKLPFRGLKKSKKLSLADQQYLISKKNEIAKLSNSDNQFELRHAVMEADKLADWILKKKNYQGSTFADRLRAAEKDIPADVYNSIWQGHKIRNLIAHEDSNIPDAQLKQAINNLLSHN